MTSEERQRTATIAFVITALLMVLTGASYVIFSRSHDWALISGYSMYPTFKDGDVVILDKTKGYNAGDIVVFDMPEEWSDLYLGNDRPNFIKRVTIPPGETFAWNGRQWIWKDKVVGSLKSGSCNAEPGLYSLAEDEVFVSGDSSVTKMLDSRAAFCQGVHYGLNVSNIRVTGTVSRIL